MPSYDAKLVADQTEQQDQMRVSRAFVGFLSSVLGVDQPLTTDDAIAAQRTGQYVIANPDGSYSVQGMSVSNRQASAQAGLVLSPTLLLLAGLAFLLLRR